MKIIRIFQIALLMELSLSTHAGAQTTIASSPSLDPHLFLTLQDFEAGKAIVQRRTLGEGCTSSCSQGGRWLSPGLSQAIWLDEGRGTEDCAVGALVCLPGHGNPLAVPPPQSQHLPGYREGLSGLADQRCSLSLYARHAEPRCPDARNCVSHDWQGDICTARSRDPQDVCGQVQGLSDCRQLWEAIEHRSAPSIRRR
jgi:hypothetical protein